MGNQEKSKRELLFNFTGLKSSPQQFVIFSSIFNSWYYLIDLTFHSLKRDRLVTTWTYLFIFKKFRHVENADLVLTGFS